MENKDNIYIKFPNNEENDTPLITIYMDGYRAQVNTVSQDNEYVLQQVAVVSKGDEFLKTILKDDDAIKLLLTAVNNRTIERNYFKLYCEMLDSSITEEEFDKIIESNEKDYVIDESGKPDESQIKTALRLAKHIKDVNNVEDFTALFSFNTKQINAIIEQSNGKIHQ